MSIIIRSAAQADAPGLAALLNPIIAAGRLIRKQATTEAEQRAFLLGFPADGLLLVATDGGRVVAMQSASPPDRGAGDSLTFVDMERQRQGIGRALTEAMLGPARAKGCKQLRAAIPNGNPWALAFYYAMDFRRIGGDWPQDIVAARSTEAIRLAPDQATACRILEQMRLSGIDEADVAARHGPTALAAAKAILADAIDAPVDWRHASMDEALSVLSNLLGKRYPWLSVKARASIASAYMFTYK
jgi:L-amino acid N-acyltransferase YncA